MKWTPRSEEEPPTDGTWFHIRRSNGITISMCRTLDGKTHAMEYLLDDGLIGIVDYPDDEWKLAFPKETE